MTKRHFARIPDPLPEWFSVVNDNSLLSAKDLGQLFGVKPNSVWDRCVNCDDFPERVRFGIAQNPKGFVVNMARWRAKDIRAWIKKRVAEGRFTV